MSKLRVGVLGVGEMGLRHAENIRYRVSHAQLVAVADVGLDRASRAGAHLEIDNANVNGMLFYTNTIHDFDLARWLMQDEVSEVHTYATVAIRPEVAEFNDVVASVVNLKFEHGAIGNIESYAQAVYGYDVRTEIVGSKGSIL